MRLNINNNQKNNIMISSSTFKQRVSSLKQKYSNLIEEAYNYSELDPSLSNISEYKAFKVLGEINELKFLN